MTRKSRTTQQGITRSDERGFTLAELIVYLSIVTIAILVFASFMVNVTKYASHSKVQREVQQNARLVLSRITQEIRTAASIDAANSVFNSDDGKLTVQGPSGALVSFYRQASSDEVYYDNGSGAVPLSSDAIRVSELRFAQVSSGVSVDLKVEQGNASAPPNAIELSSTVVPRTSLY